MEKATNATSRLNAFLAHDRLHRWSIPWGFAIHSFQCKSFTLTLRRTPVPTTYHIGDVPMHAVEAIRGLVVILVSLLTYPKLPVERTVHSAFCARFKSHPRELNWTKIPTGSQSCHLRSVLGYRSVTSEGVAKAHAQRGGKAQHKFIWLNNHCPSISLLVFWISP